jgi:hypothetical protein
VKLSSQDADLFFELMWALQHFVNRQRRLHPHIDALEAYRNLSSKVKMKVRQALYDEPTLIDAFIKENPQRFSEDKLAIIASWKDYVAGEFYIERLLKKYAVFISSDDRVYGVLALYDSFHDIVSPAGLPFFVKAVLLPFKGKIIYDGLLGGYNIYFGGGIRSGLRETYLAAKQNGRIIESLEHVQAKARREAAKELRPELAELVAGADRLRGGLGQPPLNGAAFALVKASLAFASAALEHPDDPDSLRATLKKVARALKNAQGTLDRAER